MPLASQVSQSVWKIEIYENVGGAVECGWNGSEIIYSCNEQKTQTHKLKTYKNLYLQQICLIINADIVFIRLLKMREKTIQYPIIHLNMDFVAINWPEWRHKIISLVLKAIKNEWFDYRFVVNEWKIIYQLYCSYCCLIVRLRTQPQPHILEWNHRMKGKIIYE